MDFFGDVVAWFADPAHWSGTKGIPNRIYEHLQLSGLALLVGMVIAIPSGVLLGHVRRGGIVAVSIVNIGRAMPSYAIISIALPITLRFGLGAGFWPTWIAVFLLALPPMFTNAYTAVVNIDRQVVDAARGMGMREGEVLRGVELPLAAPLILAATRVTAVQVVATAPLGALVGWGGLGRFIIDGLAVRDFVQVFAGAFLVALLAILTEVAFSAAERVVLPHGVRRLSIADAHASAVKAI